MALAAPKAMCGIWRVRGLGDVVQSEFFRRATRQAQRLALAALAGCFLQSQANAQNSPATSAISWSGFHAGVHGGYHAGGARMHFDPTFFGGPTAPLGAAIGGVPASGSNSGYVPLTTAMPAAGVALPSRIIGGFQLGYDWQMGNLVYGLEVDLSYVNGQRSNSVTLPYRPPFSSYTVTTITTSKMNWLGTLRGRLGFAGDRSLFYVTGGVATGSANAKATLEMRDNNLLLWDYKAALSPNVGWTAGAGVEFAATNNWAIKGEYLYYRLGTKSDNRGFLDFTPRVRHDGHILRVGVNYRLN